MDNNNFDKVMYDYYSNTSSYVKLIMDMMPESRASKEKKYVVKELYNYFLNRMDEEKIKEISIISNLFREQISISSLEDIAKIVDFIYNK